MTVFIAHAGPDKPAADALAKAFERRGIFVEDEDGAHGVKPLRPNDVVVLLWSKDSVFWLHRLALERRALEAWAEERLILVMLDHSIRPVGLRDLPAMDASFEERRAFTWGEVVQAAQAAAVTPPPSAGAPPGAPQAPPAPLQRRAKMGAKKGGGVVGALALLFLLSGFAMAGVWAAATFGYLPALYAWYAMLGGVVAGLLALFFSVTAMARSGAARSAPAEGAAPSGPSVFVSYAHADAGLVRPAVDAAQAQGLRFWIDAAGIEAGVGWAGEIVRAIKAADGVAVMCSPAAFESDHVKRELYLADRYKKPLAPVFVVDAAPPEDFEYFFAGVQWLKLHELPAEARGQAMAQAVKRALAV
jgi:hypothetical protein